MYSVMNTIHLDEIKHAVIVSEFSPDAQYLVVGAEAGEVIVYDVSTTECKLVKHLKGHTANLRDIAFSQVT